MTSASCSLPHFYRGSRRHQVATPNPADGDIYVSGDSPPLIWPPVLLVSRKAKRDGLTPAEKKYCKEGAACLWEFDELARATIS